MSAAQISLAILIAALIAAGTVLVIFDEMLSGWILLGVALFGVLTFLGMVANDARAARE